MCSICIGMAVIKFYEWWYPAGMGRNWYPTMNYKRNEYYRHFVRLNNRKKSCYIILKLNILVTIIFLKLLTGVKKILDQNF